MVGWASNRRAAVRRCFLSIFPEKFSEKGKMWIKGDKGDNDIIGLADDRGSLQVLSSHARPGGRLFQGCNFNFLHLQHGPHNPARFFRIRVSQQFPQRPGNYLPREAVSVFQPAALLRLWVSAFREFSPVMIYFLLRFTVDDK